MTSLGPLARKPAMHGVAGVRLGSEPLPGQRERVPKVVRVISRPSTVPAERRNELKPLLLTTVSMIPPGSRLLRDDVVCSPCVCSFAAAASASALACRVRVLPVPVAPAKVYRWTRPVEPR